MVSFANSRVYRHRQLFDRPGNLGAGLTAVLMLLVSASGSAFAESNYAFDNTPGKLPKTVIPVHYAIELTPDLEHLTIAGTEVIDIQVREPTARLTLNAVDMTFGAASIDDDAQRGEIALDAATEAATLTFPQPLAAGAHRLHIGFTARINSFGRGLFFVDYPTDQGIKRMLSSQLEPADARRIFPCWDEPAFKATFALTVTVPRAFMAVSNMPVVREEPVAPDRKQVAFAPRRKCRVTCSCSPRANSNGSPRRRATQRSVWSPPRAKAGMGASRSRTR